MAWFVKFLLRLKSLIVNHPAELLLTIVWAVSICLVNPVGNFPLNDDWAYAKNVYHLYAEGRLLLSSWPAMTLIAQVLWGATLCHLFGFSFTVLRISTLVISLVGVIVFYRLSRNVTNNKHIALFGSFLLLFNPIYFSLSFTFMTEIYFVSASIIAFFYYFNYAKSGKATHIIAGTIFAVISTLVRQHGLMIPLVFTVIYLLDKKLSVKRLFYSMIPLLFTMTILVGYLMWLKLIHQLPDKIWGNIHEIINSGRTTDLGFIYMRLGLLMLYIGLFLIPLVVALLPSLKGAVSSKAIVFILGTELILFKAMLFSWRDFPIGNIIYNFGLGPKLLKDAFWGDNIYPLISKYAWFSIRILALLSVLVLIYHAYRSCGNVAKVQGEWCWRHARLAKISLSLIFIVYCLFSSINADIFDRYILPIFPVAIIIMLSDRPKYTVSTCFAGWFIMTLMGLFSLTLTHDYLSWNRARWEALDYLIKERSIKPSQIDGGLEFNAWYQTGAMQEGEREGVSWWFVGDDQYVISFGHIAGFSELKRIEYKRLMPPGRDYIYILCK